jgi:hypothetical protein
MRADVIHVDLTRGLGGKNHVHIVWLLIDVA